MSKWIDFIMNILLVAKSGMPNGMNILVVGSQRVNDFQGTYSQGSVRVFPNVQGCGIQGGCPHDARSS